MSEKMREEFEAWAASYRDHNGLPHFTLRRPDGKYVDGTTELCWRVWQASSESLVIELPEVATDEYIASVKCQEARVGMLDYRAGVEDTKDAIRTAGIRTK